MTTIPESFANKNIFITGGSGFIGKVLIEKLLRSCPEVGNIYLLMKPKHGLNLEERIKKITESPLFDKLKQERYENLKKIKLIPGDITKLDLGISQEDRTVLIKEVNIIYHAAASVRFDDPISKALILNTRATREVCYLALEIKNLDAFVHISTTYCNTDKPVVEEILYPPHTDWKEAIRLAEELDENTFNIFTKKYIKPLINTYTFAKSLAEHVVNDLCIGKIPTIIFRPSVVINIVNDPLPGWVDNFNGPVGILVASGKGILRSVYAKPNTIADYMPVDIIVKSLIVVTWHKLNEDKPLNKLEVTIYNGSNNNVHHVSLENIVQMSKTMTVDIPFNDILWSPTGTTTKCWYQHFFKIIFFHLIPALFVDGLLMLTGNKPRLLGIQRKMYAANMALEYFLCNEWIFHNQRLSSMQNKILDCDKHEFSNNLEKMDPFEYYRNAIYGSRKYLLNEDDSSLPRAKIHYKRMYVISKIADFLWYFALVWLLFVKLDVLSILQQKQHNLLLYLTSD